MLTPTIIFLLAAAVKALPNFCEQKVKLEKSSHIWHHTRNSTRSYVCLQLSLHLHFLAKGGGEQSIKRVQKYDLYHNHDRRIWKMAIIILQWFIWLQISFFLHSIQSICLRFLFWMCWCKNIFRIQFANIMRFCKSRILSLSTVMNETWCDDLTVSYFKSNKH